MFEIQQQVTDEYVSSPYNHVHHATCLRFLEEARVRYLEKIGFPLQYFLDKQMFMVVTSVAVSYKREVLKGAIRVTCENPKIEGKILAVEQKILNPKGKVALEARVECMILSGETKRSIPFPPDFTESFLKGGKRLN
jgi:YbgC/YbaW family acyl-CoA thioester hydrolase